MTPDEDSARFDELEARANELGWELARKGANPPWGYVLYKPGQPANPHTASAARLDPDDEDNLLSGLDSVSHMLDQIQFLQEHEGDE
jgi:hypothetical protein